MKIAKLAVVLLALLGLVGLETLLSRTERVRPDARAAGPSAAPEEQATVEPAELVALDAPAAEGESRTPVAKASTSIRVPRPAARTSAETIHLSGTIIAVDELGIEHPAEDGSFFLTLASARALRVVLADARSARLGVERLRDVMDGLGDTGPPFVPLQGNSGLLVRVRAGSWSADPPREPILDEVRDGTWRLGIQSCELGGRAAVQLEDHDEPTRAPERPQALRVRWLPDLVLEVRERSSGRPLDHVILYELDNQPTALHPGLSAEKEARDAGPSPVRIAPRPSWLGARHFFAKGPGLAWGHIEILSGQDEEHVLLLDPGGDLELVVTGATRDRSTELRLIRSEGLRGRGFIRDAPQVAKALALDVPLRDQTALRIDGLPVGRYSAQAEIHPEAPILVGSCGVEVRADTTVTAVLALEPPPTAHLVPFEGELVLPAEWQLASFRLSFVRRAMGGQTRELDSSELVRKAGTRDRYRWALPPVPPGRYDVRIDCGYTSVLDTGPAGRRDARIEVPPPCKISVHCIDETGADARPESLSWNAVDERITSLATWNPEHDRWEFQAPAGELSIQNTGRSYWDSSTKITATPGTNEVELRLRRAR